MKIIILVITLTYINTIYTKCYQKLNILDCSSQNLDKVDYLQEYLQKNTSKAITTINLRNNSIRSITTNNFKRFTNVQSIDLSNNNIEHIANDSFKFLSKLRILNLKDNDLLNVPLIISRSLINLNLNGNRIHKLSNHDFWRRNRIQNLSISNNFITEIQPLALYNLRRKLTYLSLYGNKLSEVPTKALQYLTKLFILDLRRNQLTKLLQDSFRRLSSLKKVFIFDYKHYGDTTEHDIKIDVHAFRNMRSLRELRIHSIHAKLDYFPNLQGTDNLRFLSLRGIKNLTFPSNFCFEKVKIQRIYVMSSTMASFPALSNCKRLNTLDFVENEITYIPANAFSGLSFVENIEILQNRNSVEKINPNAFANLPSLLELDLSHFPLGVFPNLNGTTNLRQLTLTYCKIQYVPEYICQHLPNLRILNLDMNSIRKIPQLTQCFSLENVYFFHNEIQDISKTFIGLKSLHHVDLSENHIQRITDQTFQKCSKLRLLNISRNLLSKIEEKSFVDSSNIKVLDISHNYDLIHLPTTYLQSLTEIKAEKNRKMIDFPTQEDLPHATRLSLVYPYHCCFFMRKVQQIKHEISVKELINRNSEWTVVKNHDFYNPPAHLNISRQTKAIEMENMEPLLRWMNNDSRLFFNAPPGSGALENNLAFHDLEEPYCIPTPNEFYPCDDLMGKQWLRICVWVVFLFSMLGNITVLLVSLINIKRLDVPRYLIINLAFADLCLSIYLGFLAFVDIITLGDFRSHALNWQFSSSCKGAGFLAVFAAELSVYTLAVITIERYTTIKNSMHVVRRMTTKHAIIIMIVGWVLSIILAALPLNSINGHNFSDYTKYSVCLPFEIGDTSSKIYVVFLLMFNLIAFIVVLTCYVKIYFIIRGSNAWNSGDSRAARRMAILIFTDFFCWFPIALTALSAIFDQSLLPNLWMSKIIAVLIFPLNACANPFLYAILTKQFRKDLFYCAKQIKQKSSRNRGIRRSLLRLPLKGSLTYSTSVRRGSSCSFLFARRWSSKTGEDIKNLTKGLRRHTEDEPVEYQERLTSV